MNCLQTVFIVKYSFNKHVFYRLQEERFKKWQKTVFTRAVFTADWQFGFTGCQPINK